MFLELVTLKKARAFFLPVYSYKLSWKILIGFATVLCGPRESIILDYVSTLGYRELCPVIETPTKTT